MTQKHTSAPTTTTSHRFFAAYYERSSQGTAEKSYMEPLRKTMVEQAEGRVLKPGGHLLMVEHVRAQRRVAGFVQDLLTPFTSIFIGNCHWNRRTEQAIHNAGFQEIDLERRILMGGLLPIIILVAKC